MLMNAVIDIVVVEIQPGKLKNKCDNSNCNTTFCVLLNKTANAPKDWHKNDKLKHHCVVPKMWRRITVDELPAESAQIMEMINLL